MSLVTVNGRRVHALRLRVPFGGVWYADVDTDGDTALEGAATLTVGGDNLVGTVDPDHGGTFAKAGSYRIVGGKGKWGTVLPRRQYHNDAETGIRRNAIARDAAREAGETLVVLAADAGIGTDYVRAEGPARTVLDQQFGDAWWVDYAGTTFAGERPDAAAGSDVEVLRFDPRTRVATLALDDLASVGVGTELSRRLDAPVTVRELEVEVKDGKFRASAYCGELPGKNRIQGAVARMARAAFPRAAFAVPYRYRVLRMSVDRVELQAVRKLAGLPDVLPVSIWPGMAGLWAKLAPASIVLVSFIEGDPTQPIVTHCTPKDSVAGFLPVELLLDATELVQVGPTAALVELGSGSETLDAVQAVGRVVRYGDKITFGPQGSTAALTFTTPAESVAKVRA